MNRTVTSEDVRASFLQHFLSNGHARIEGSSLIPHNDPTLLFINSGMAPLKPYFTGQQRPPQSDLCNVQPCLRTKDIDDVGDRHHLTFFEMLGSWSINNYFKQQAIDLAYGLLTDGFGFDSERLFVSVFAGDSALGLAPDEESAQHWEAVGIPRDRIVAMGAADNFWGPAGDTGPCGPCTEVFYDFGPEYGDAYRVGDVFDTTSRYIEIWNAGVFMQFDKRRDGSFDSLPFVSVDTGAGIERLTMAINEMATVYETDLLEPLVGLAQELLGDSGEAQDHHRLLADHMRAATFILSEGVRPSNEGRGYVPRRLLRKCIAVAKQHSTGSSFDLRAMASAVVGLMSDHYPQLRSQQNSVLELLSAEERDFSRAVERGLDHLAVVLDSGEAMISGKEAFNLFATYGLPLEITRDFAAQRGVSVDQNAFLTEFEAHQRASRARDKSEANKLSPTDPLPDLPLPSGNQFVGYDSVSTSAEVVAIFASGERTAEATPGQHVEVLLDTTPFYAEGGGQVGDRGLLTVGDDVQVLVNNTTKHASGYHVHGSEIVRGVLREGAIVLAEVDNAVRRKTAANHSATHLLNAALRQVLGSHVRQAGSLVDAERLRFDFTNPQALTTEQQFEIERIVNEAVLAALPRSTDVLAQTEARETGAVFLENEDYGDSVRVVRFGDASVEFCGGTHVDVTSDIGLFRIVSEQAVAAGVRRINAMTREGAVALTLERDRLLMAAAGLLKVSPANLPERLEQLTSRVKAASTKQKGNASAIDLAVDKSGPVASAGALVDDDVDIRSVAQREAERLTAVVALMSEESGKTRVVVAVPAALADAADARDVLAGLVHEMSGSGGGSPRVAQGGGRATREQAFDVIARLPSIVRGARAAGNPS